ncbi:MAG: anti-phage defense ZorAB system ZorA [Desulfamplus sp.]|nr:anti-phage defense ZorAB system ZorA [Desulfamplus sp.]
MDQINFGQLLPDLSDFFIWPIQRTTELSAWFLVLLGGVTLCALFISLCQFFGVGRRISWLKKMVKNETSETIAQKRQDFLEKAQKIKHEAAHLWKEFDETLIEREQNGIVHLYSTYDAAYFFNTSTLAARITESRLLAAVPSFLTAIGVIGTFVGLQLGLSQLNIASDVTLDEMKSGVAGVINGAKLAFMTSVWGVVLSVLFNFYEKFLAGRAHRKITHLQKSIDNLFPRLSAESQLQRIADDGKQSRESLQGLAEKIGEKMQESLLDATAGIQSGLEASLQKIMAPAIDKLVNETSDGNQKALETLVEKFMDKFGEQGSQQRDAMDQTSARVNAALDGLSTSMNAFVNNLKASQHSSGEREKELVNSISIQVSQLVEQGNEQKRMLTEFVEKQLENMGNEFNRREEAAQQREQELANKLSDQVTFLVQSANRMNKAIAEFVGNKLSTLTQNFDDRDKGSAEREEERNRIFVEQTSAMNARTEQLLERVEKGFNTQLAASDQLIEQGKNLQIRVESSIRASAEATTHMKETAIELNSAASSMNVFGTQIREAGNRLSDSVMAAVESTHELAKQNQLSSERMETLRAQLLNDTARFKDVVQQMQSLITSANTTFDNMSTHQRQYLAGLDQNVKDLALHMAELLEDYADSANSQTERHLKVWAEGTTQYASQMNSAVNALSGMVDEIEVKLGH